MPNRASRESSRYRQQAGQLAEMLKAGRLDRGMSQQQLAQVSGIAIGTVRALESRRTVEPGFFTVLVLAEALGIDVPGLVERIGNPSARPLAQ